MNKNNKLTVTLVEHIASGHHTEYLLHTISEFSKNNIKVHFVGATDICDQIADKVESVTPLLLDANCDPFRRELRRISFCKKVFQLAKKNNSDLVHFLYVDRLLRALFFSQPKFNRPIIATLHWAYMLNQFTQTKKQKLAALIERWVLNKLFKRGLKLIVHSNNIAVELNDIIKDSTIALNYPVANEYKFSELGRIRIRKILGITNDDTLLLCFGATRLDKGADIAINAHKYLPHNYHLLIAGKEQDISYIQMEKIASDNSIEQQFHLIKGFISDDDVIDIFSAADIVLLPYRSGFSGQSGPLTIAAAIGKPVVATKVEVLAETINNYQLGATIEEFNSENYHRAIMCSYLKNKKNTQSFVTDSTVQCFSRALVNLYHQSA